MTSSSALARARRQAELGFWEAGRDALHQLAERSPSEQVRTEAHLELGKLYLWLERYAEAVQPLLTAAQKVPESPHAHYLLGLAYRGQQRWADAVSALQTAGRLSDDDPAVLANLGFALYQQGNRAEGLKLLNQALRLNLGRLPTLLDMTLLYVSEGNLPAALSCAHRAYQLSMGRSLEATEMGYTLQGLKAQMEAQGMIPPEHPPRNEQEWRERISVATEPMALIRETAEQSKPQSTRDVQKIAARIMRWWNTTHRPELGGLAPNQVQENAHSRPSRVELPPAPPYLKLDQAAFDANTLRRDMAAFLAHLQEASYPATSTRGNLPLKAIRAINPLLVNPVPLEHQIGDYTAQVRTVQDVWRLEFLQVLAVTGKLAQFKKGKRIRLTREGQKFLDAAPTYQVWKLLDAWWWHTDWRYVYQWQILEEYPAALPMMTLTLLWTMRIGVWVPISEFIDMLIEGAALEPLFSTPNPMPRRCGLERMTVSILADFELVEVKKRSRQIGDYLSEDAVSFRLTSHGAQLLRTL